MKLTSHFVAAAAATGSIAMSALPVSAFEFGYPGVQIAPSAFLNTPATTPPPGLYGSLQINTARPTSLGPNPLNVNGFPTHTTVDAPSEALVYVPGFNVLGGVYSASIIQQETFDGVGAPVGVTQAGFHNTVLFPIILGYKLGDSGFYVKTALGVSVPNGTIDGPTGLGNAGDPFVSLLPRVTVQYLNNGWSFANTVVGEYNTTNPITGYRSGFVIRDEAVLTRTIGRFTFGPAVTAIGQVASDKSSAYYNYQVNVNRFSQLGVGGFVGYDFGPASVNLYGVSDILTSASGGTRPPAFPTRDSANFSGGYNFFLNINFKIPGIGALGTPVEGSALGASASR